MEHMEVILENIEGKLDLVVEGQQALESKIDRHYGEFKEFQDEVDYKFSIVFEELHSIREEKVNRDEFYSAIERLESKIGKTEHVSHS